MLADTAAGISQDATASILWPIVGVVFLTLIFLLVDLYGTTNQFRWVFGVLAFYILWGLQSFLGIIAYFILEVSSSKDFKEHVGNALVAHWLQALFAVLGSVTVVQSLTFKVSGKKVVDVGPWIEKFRKRVFDQIGEAAINGRKKEASLLISKLSKKYADRGAALEAELSSALFVALNSDRPKVNEELEKIRQSCADNLVRGYAESLVIVDLESARRLADLQEP